MAIAIGLQSLHRMDMRDSLNASQLALTQSRIVARDQYDALIGLEGLVARTMFAPFNCSKDNFKEAELRVDQEHKAAIWHGHLLVEVMHNVEKSSNNSVWTGLRCTCKEQL
jgi:hypothetical protein